MDKTFTVSIFDTGASEDVNSPHILPQNTVYYGDTFFQVCLPHITSKIAESTLS